MYSTKGRRLRQFATVLAATQVRQLLPSTSAVPTLAQRVNNARKLREVYRPGFAFPAWSVDDLQSGKLEELAQTVSVYYPMDADLMEVEELVKQREPVNIAMRRLYDEGRMKEYFGYSRGAYDRSSPERLMPNIAIYCKTPMQFGNQREEVHVVNVIGFAFDSPQQPDYQHFRHKGGIRDLIQKMNQMWEYVFFCARNKELDRVYLPNVGGGAFFAGLREHCNYEWLKRESLEPVRQRYPDIEVFDLPHIPAWVFSDGRSSLKCSLLVNAWDPWSMVGNGNEGDNSLDGFFGRCTAMALLCWPLTNPYMSYQKVPAMSA